MGFLRPVKSEEKANVVDDCRHNNMLRIVMHRMVVCVELVFSFDSISTKFDCIELSLGSYGKIIMFSKDVFENG